MANDGGAGGGDGSSEGNEERERDDDKFGVGMSVVEPMLSRMLAAWLNNMS